MRREGSSPNRTRRRRMRVIMRLLAAALMTANMNVSSPRAGFLDVVSFRRNRMAKIELLRQNPLENRFRGNLPKIGIRPIIDGRQNGVRESLEDQTMNMARQAAKLISDSLR